MSRYVCKLCQPAWSWVFVYASPERSDAINVVTSVSLFVGGCSDKLNKVFRLEGVA